MLPGFATLSDKATFNTVEIEEPIEHFAIPGLFWINLAGHQLSFAFEWLPKDVHFTLVFGITHGIMNLHVTKNIQGPEKKPQLRIFEIETRILEENHEALIRNIFRKILVPVEFTDTEETNQDSVKYVSFDKLSQSDTYPEVQEELFENLRPLKVPYRKKRLKVALDEEKLEQAFSNLPLLKNAIADHSVDLSAVDPETMESGMLHDATTSIAVMKFGNQWYSLNTELKLADILSSFLPDDLAKRMIRKTLESIIHVKNAQSHAEIEHLNIPIRLIVPEKIDP